MNQDTIKRPRHRPIDEGKRSAILDSACEEFFTHGFAAASIETIAANSNVSKVTIYNRFGTKEALFVEVVERECQKMSFGLADFDSTAADLRGQLINFGKRATDFLTSPQIVRFERRIGAETEQRPEIGELFLDAGPRKLHAKLTEVMERAVARHAIKPCDCGLAAGHLYGMIIGFDIFMARFSMAPPDTAQLHKHVVLAVDEFLQAYGI
jgi:TetR/AcrR family transcriptional regulator, mexJK operon transcriptional repressor